MTSKEKLIEFLKSANIEYIIKDASEGEEVIIYSTSKVYVVFDKEGEFIYMA